MIFSALNPCDQELVSNAKKLLTVKKEPLSVYMMKCHMIMSDVLKGEKVTFEKLVPLIELAYEGDIPDLNYEIDTNTVMKYHKILVTSTPSKEELLEILFLED